MGVCRQAMAVRALAEDEWGQVVDGCGTGAHPARRSPCGQVRCCRLADQRLGCSGLPIAICGMTAGAAGR